MTQENSSLTSIADREVEFMPLGASDKIRLSAALVSNFIAVPTKSGKLPSERDCIKFIMLCKGKQANPFEGDVFMIGYDTDQGRGKPSFSMVCGIELFFKRAEQNEQYDGRESGIIIQNDEGLVYREGCLKLQGEIIVGGWAKVYRKDMTHAEYKAVNFATYDTGKSRWKKDPAGQIEKVALSQALRQAFPTPLGGLYTQMEMERVTEDGDMLIGAEAREPITMPTVIESGEVITEGEPPVVSAGDTDTDEWTCSCGALNTRRSPYCETCGLYRGEDPETGRYYNDAEGNDKNLFTGSEKE